LPSVIIASLTGIVPVPGIVAILSSSLFLTLLFTSEANWFGTALPR